MPCKKSGGGMAPPVAGALFRDFFLPFQLLVVCPFHLHLCKHFDNFLLWCFCTFFICCSKHQIIPNSLSLLEFIASCSRNGGQVPKFCKVAFSSKVFSRYIFSLFCCHFVVLLHHQENTLFHIVV